jgi:hypothetical protein
VNEVRHFAVARPIARAAQSVEYDEIIVHDHDFDIIGADFSRATGLERTGRVGEAEARLMPQQALVDYAAVCFAPRRSVHATAS